MQEQDNPQAVDETVDNSTGTPTAEVSDAQEETGNPPPEQGQGERSDPRQPESEPIHEPQPLDLKRVLVTGSRTWPDKAVIANALLQWWLRNDRPQMILVSGGARGADQMAEEVWNTQKFPIEQHLANWEQYGKRAGALRNIEMVKLGADVCFAFIHNASRGATHCARVAFEAGIPTIIYRIDDSEEALEQGLYPKSVDDGPRLW